MIYNISIDEEAADLLNELEIDDLSRILSDEDERKSLKYALSRFKNAYCEAIENEDCFLTMEESEQSYNFQADKCN